MNRIALAVALYLVACQSQNLLAQDKPKTEDKAEIKKELVPLRVQVVIVEYDGEKKISSLPYTLLVNAQSGERGPKASIRMGLNVPIRTSEAQFTYQHVGTNLDAYATRTEDGRFSLHVSIDRSSTYATVASHGSSGGAGEISANQPVIQQFSTELDVLMHDGQTIQTTVATDPVSGRVTKVDVTANVVK